MLAGNLISHDAMGKLTFTVQPWLRPLLSTLLPPDQVVMIDFTQPIIPLSGNHYGTQFALGQSDVLLQFTLQPEYRRGDQLRRAASD